MSTQMRPSSRHHHPFCGGYSRAPGDSTRGVVFMVLICPPMSTQIRPGSSRICGLSSINWLNQPERWKRTHWPSSKCLKRGCVKLWGNMFQMTARCCLLAGWLSSLVSHTPSGGKITLVPRNKCLKGGEKLFKIVWYLQGASPKMYKPGKMTESRIL